MADYIIQDTTLKAIANSIRSKTDCGMITPLEMASIISTLSTGGGGGSSSGIVGKYLLKDETSVVSSKLTATHNLGVKPDIILAMYDNNSASGDRFMLFQISFNKDLAQAAGLPAPIYRFYRNGNNDVASTVNYDYFDSVIVADETTFTISGSAMGPFDGKYDVLVIGGLY